MKKRLILEFFPPLCMGAAFSPVPAPAAFRENRRLALRRDNASVNAALRIWR